MSDAHDPDEPILTAALAVLTERGDLTMGAVARRAGVSRGTLYRRFGDRDRLLARVAERQGTSAAALVRGPRERLLDGVGAVLAEHGLAALTVDAVARHAELGPATVYRHFESRDALLATFAAERSPRRLVAMLDESPGSDIEGDLRRLAEAGLRFAHEQPGLVRLAMGPDAERFSARTGDSRRVRVALVEYFGRQVAAGRLVGEPRLMAASFAGMVLALGTPELSGEAASDPEVMAAFVAQMMVHGLRPP